MLKRLAQSIADTAQLSIARYVSESAVIPIARSLIAVAQISLIVFTPYDARYPEIWQQGIGPNCEGIRQASMYCLAGDTPGHLIDGVIVTLLIVIIIGPLPRYISLLHYWVTISISWSIGLPDGGESIAQAAVFFLIFVSLADTRRWQWSKPTKVRSSLTPIAWAGTIALRLQMAWVYLNASIAKTSVPEWVEGSAVYYVSRDPYFGVAGPLEPFLLGLLEIPVFALIASWGAIIIEFVIAICLLWSIKTGKIAFIGSLFLHIAFIVVIGLWSFAIIMIASVLAASSQSWLQPKAPKKSTLHNLSSGVLAPL